MYERIKKGLELLMDEGRNLNTPKKEKLAKDFGECFIELLNEVIREKTQAGDEVGEELLNVCRSITENVRPVVGNIQGNVEKIVVSSYEFETIKKYFELLDKFLIGCRSSPLEKSVKLIRAIYETASKINNTAFRFHEIKNVLEGILRIDEDSDKVTHLNNNLDNLLSIIQNGADGKLYIIVEEEPHVTGARKILHFFRNLWEWLRHKPKFVIYGKSQKSLVNSLQASVSTLSQQLYSSLHNTRFKLVQDSLGIAPYSVNLEGYNFETENNIVLFGKYVASKVNFSALANLGGLAYLLVNALQYYVAIIPGFVIYKIVTKILSGRQYDRKINNFVRTYYT